MVVAIECRRLPVVVAFLFLPIAARLERPLGDGTMPLPGGCPPLTTGQHALCRPRDVRRMEYHFH